MFEKETIELYRMIQAESKKNPGHWQHSRTENWKVNYFPKNLDKFSLVNFRRTPMADGMISFPDRPLRNERKVLSPWILGIPTIQKIRGIRDILVTIKRLRSVFRFGLPEVNDNLIGNPCHYKIGKYNVTDFSIRMCFYQKSIEQEFAEKKKINVLEIGGGFGGICQRLFSSKKINVETYGLVELPEILPLAYWYLKNSGLTVSVIFSESDELGVLKERGVVLLTPWMLSKINGGFNLFVNTMSFHHMNKKNLDCYFSDINRLNIPKLFLVEGKIRNGEEVNFDDYPIPAKYQLIKEEPYPFSNHSVRTYKCK